MHLSLILRDIILVAIGINVALSVFGYLLNDQKLLATSLVSLASLLIAIALKAYDLFE